MAGPLTQHNVASAVGMRALHLYLFVHAWEIGASGELPLQCSTVLGFVLHVWRGAAAAQDWRWLHKGEQARTAGM